MTSVCQNPSNRTKKKMKTGSKVNDIGSLQLHSKHDIVIETLDTGLARATVRDQLFIDKLLLAGLITLHQHSRAGYFLRLAELASVHLCSPSLSPIVSGGVRKSDLYNRGLLKLSRALKDVRHLHGQLGVDVIQDHIIEEDRHTKDKHGYGSMPWQERCFPRHKKSPLKRGQYRGKNHELSECSSR
jgi:hypothetical protein